MEIIKEIFRMVKDRINRLLILPNRYLILLPIPCVWWKGSLPERNRLIQHLKQLKIGKCREFSINGILIDTDTPYETLFELSNDYYVRNKREERAFVVQVSRLDTCSDLIETIGRINDMFHSMMPSKPWGYLV